MGRQLLSGASAGIREGQIFSFLHWEAVAAHLHGLAPLLCVCQQLDGDGPAVLHGILQVNERVAHVMAHGAFPADGHGAGLTEEQEHLQTEGSENTKNKKWGSYADAAELLLNVKRHLYRLYKHKA